MGPCRKHCVMKSSVCIVLPPGTHLVAVASRRSRNEELRSGALPRPIASNLKIRWCQIRRSDDQMIRWSDDDQMIRWCQMSLVGNQTWRLQSWSGRVSLLESKPVQSEWRTCKPPNISKRHQLWCSIHRDSEDHFRLVLNLMFTMHMIHKPGVC